MHYEIPDTIDEQRHIYNVTYFLDHILNHIDLKNSKDILDHIRNSLREIYKINAKLRIAATEYKRLSDILLDQIDKKNMKE